MVVVVEWGDAGRRLGKFENPSLEDVLGGELDAASSGQVGGDRFCGDVREHLAESLDLLGRGGEREDDGRAAMHAEHLVTTEDINEVWDPPEEPVVVDDVVVRVVQIVQMGWVGIVWVWNVVVVDDVVVVVVHLKRGICSNVGEMAKGGLRRRGWLGVLVVDERHAAGGAVVLCLEPLAEAPKVEDVAAGEPLGGGEGLAADGADLVAGRELLGADVGVPGAHVGGDGAVVAVGGDLLAQVEEGRAQVEEQGSVDEGEGDAVEEQDVHVMRQRREEYQRVGDELGVVDVGASVLPRLRQREVVEMDGVLDDGLHHLQEQREALERQQKQHRRAGLCKRGHTEPEPAHVGDEDEAQEREDLVVHGVGRVHDVAADVAEPLTGEKGEELEEAQDGEPGGPDEQLPQVGLEDGHDEDDLEEDEVDGRLGQVGALGASEGAEEDQLQRPAEQEQRAVRQVHQQQQRHLAPQNQTEELDPVVALRQRIPDHHSCCCKSECRINCHFVHFFVKKKRERRK